MRVLSKLLIVLILSSCQTKTIENNETGVVSEITSIYSDTVQIHNNSDEIAGDERIIEEKFMAFFGNFMWNNDFQMGRIVFPIILDENQIESVNHWKYYSFYPNKNYMPILHTDTVTYFDKDILVDLLKMSIVSFENQNYKNYDFKRTQEGWKLINVDTQDIDSLKDIDFFNFLKQFSSDSLFQMEHIAFPIPNYHLDYGNFDHELLYDTLYSENWRHLKLANSLEGIMTLNVNEDSDYRMIFLRGIDNGIHVKYTFMKFENIWKLIRLEDYSM